MTRLLFKLCMLSLPLMLLIGIDLALPVDAFTFRAWEALAVGGRIADTRLAALFPYTTLQGPFLPQMRLDRIDEGDLGHGTPFAVSQAVVWETDEYGFRARADLPDPDLVIVGDSNVAGSGLTQRDTLAEVMSSVHGVRAYPFAPASLSSFGNDVRFRNRPPKAVVIAVVERDFLSEFSAGEVPRGGIRLVRSGMLKRLEVALVRVRRLNLLRYIRASINGRSPPLAYGGMLFLQGPGAIKTPDPGDLFAAAEKLASYGADMRARGIGLAVLIIPNKETIYADLLPGAPKPTLLRSLRWELHSRGVEMLDIESAFRAARMSGSPPYLRDDTHWNALGVRLAAQAIADWMHRSNTTSGN
jgi:alginate O-acetyltransferase complex protein AlgJ